jgi:hypothetical protein
MAGERVNCFMGGLAAALGLGGVKGIAMKWIGVMGWDCADRALRLFV